MPRVSIGLPVYNGEDYLEETVESFLRQTFDDFELIISDNASTDNTQQICEFFVSKNRRIRYYRNEENRGAAWNYNRVFELSKGEFFKWSAHDDLCAPTFLERCVEVLDQNSSVILCYSKTSIIDKQGSVVGKDPERFLVTSRKPCQRFKQYLLDADGACFKVFGVIRSSILQKTPLIGNHLSSDRVLLANLALLGPFYKIPEELFFWREHPKETGSTKLDASHAEWYDPTHKGKLTLPRSRRTWEYMKSTMFLPDLSVTTRLCCLVYLGRWIWWVKPALIKEISVFAKHLLFHRNLS